MPYRSRSVQKLAVGLIALAGAGPGSAASRPASAAGSAAGSSDAGAEPGASPSPGETAGHDGLTSYGATTAAWNARHRNGAGYTNITPQGGRIVEYTVTIGSAPTADAIKRAKMELPADARELWGAQKGNCYQVELASRTLGRALAAPSTGDPSGGILAIMNTLLPDGSSVYRPTSVNEIMLSPGAYPAPADAPDC